MDVNQKQELTVKTMHVEFTLLRAEIRINWVLILCCVFAAVLIPFIGLIVSGILNQFYRMLILLVSSALSIFFILLGLVLCGVVVNLALRITEIEERLNNILGGDVVRWETYSALFPRIGEDILVTSIYRYIIRCGVLCFMVGIVPVVINLWQGLDILHQTLGDIVIIFMILYAVAAGITIIFGYKFWYKKDWEKVKV